LRTENPIGGKWISPSYSTLAFLALPHFSLVDLKSAMAPPSRLPKFDRGPRDYSPELQLGKETLIHSVFTQMVTGLALEENSGDLLRSRIGICESFKPEHIFPEQ
jgi:hypothetical protein